MTVLLETTGTAGLNDPMVRTIQIVQIGGLTALPRRGIAAGVVILHLPQGSLLLGHRRSILLPLLTLQLLLLQETLLGLREEAVIGTLNLRTHL